MDPKLRSDYSMQTAIGVERQLPRNTTMAFTYTNNRSESPVADRADQHSAAGHIQSAAAAERHQRRVPLRLRRGQYLESTNPAAS